MPANFIGREEEPGGTPTSQRPRRNKTAKDLPRRALLYLGGLLLAVVATALLLTGHTEGWEELAPLAITGLGLLAIGNVLYEPDRSARGLLWLTASLLAIGGCYGVIVHIDEISSDAGNIVLDLIAPALLIVGAGLMVCGSVMERAPDTDDAETDSLIAKALGEIDERRNNP